MRQTTLRRRLYSVFLRWSVLFLLVAGSLTAFAFARIRAAAMDERLLISETFAHYLDSTIADLFRNLRATASEIRLSDEHFAARLRAGRLQWIFCDAIYVLDEGGGMLMADPPSATAIPAPAVSRRESVTAALRKSGSEIPYVAAVQPFRDGDRRYTLISEMHLRDSAVSDMLRELSVGRQEHLFVVDAGGAIIASPDEQQLLRVIPAAGEIREAILGHQTFQMSDSRCWFYDDDAGTEYATVMVPLRYAPWGVVLQEPARQAFLAAYTSRNALLATLGFLIVTGLWVLAAVSSSVLRPIRELSQQAERLRQGDLSRPIRPEGDHEIRVLAATLDEARVQLLGSFAELEALNDRLEEEVAERTREIEKLLDEALANDARRRSLVRRLLAAGEDERKRIARELHDEISQLLTVVQLSLRNTSDAASDGGGDLVKADDLLAKAQKELHRVIYDLRPSLLDDLGLAAAIEWYAKNYLSDRGIEVHLEVEEGLRPPPEIEITTFRIYQEIVTNVLRHSRAENVSIELYSRHDRIVLAVEDDGVGFDVDGERGRGSLGIIGMRERAAIVDGSIEIDSEPGLGTQVIVAFPLT